MAIDIEAPGTSGANYEDILLYSGAGSTNVLWYGADRTGATDCTTAVQAAFDDDAGNNGFTSTTRGGVFFPPGTYKFESSVILGATSLRPQGQGRIWAHNGTVLLTANFAGFIFDDPNPIPGSPDGDPPVEGGTNHSAQRGLLEGLNFINTSTNAAAGCVRIEHTFGPGWHIRNCSFQGHHGVLLGGSDAGGEKVAFDSTVDSCHFIALGSEASRDTNGIGLGLGFNTRALNCSFQLWDNAVLLWGGQAAITASRMEVNNRAIRVGLKPDLSTVYNATGAVISNISFESNRYDIHCQGTGALSVSGCVSQGQNTGDHDSQTSFYYDGGQGIVISAYTGSGTYDLSSVFYINTTPPTDTPGITFIGCGGGLLRNGALNMAGCVMINSHFNGAEFDITFAQAPTYATLGTKRIFTDAEEKTAGTTLTQADVGVTAIQGTGSQTVEAMYNGTDWILTAILA
jgi:hypothetical protein